MIISLKKATPEWWDGLEKGKTYKRFIKCDFAKFCEEEDPEYTGDIAISGDEMGMGGMGMGGLPGMVRRCPHPPAPPWLLPDACASRRLPRARP